VVKVEGNEEIHVMGKARKHLKWPMNAMPKHKASKTNYYEQQSLKSSNTNMNGLRDVISEKTS